MVLLFEIMFSVVLYPVTWFFWYPKKPNRAIPNFPFVKVPLRPIVGPATVLYPPLSPTVYPWAPFFLVMILMMPLRPSASYFAGGVVITSIFSILVAGIAFNTSEGFLAIMADSLPLISIL